MTGHSRRPRIIVDDAGADAVRLPDQDGQAVIIVRPGQTFSSAVAAICRVMPLLHVDVARDLVRTNIPGATDLTALEPPFQVDRAPEVARAGRPSVRTAAGVGVVLVMVLSGGLGWGANTLVSARSAAAAEQVDPIGDVFFGYVGQVDTSCNVSPEGGTIRCIQDGVSVTTERLDHPSGDYSVFAVSSARGSSQWYVTKDQATYARIQDNLRPFTRIVYGDGQRTLVFGVWPGLAPLMKALGFEVVTGRAQASPPPSMKTQ